MFLRLRKVVQSSNYQNNATKITNQQLDPISDMKRNPKEAKIKYSNILT